MAVKKKLVSKKNTTLRSKAKLASDNAKKPRKIQKAKSGLKLPFVSIAKVLKKEYYIPLPDNKYSNFLNKRRYIIPKYIRNAYQEIKEVQWPSRKETIKLSTSVFVFAIVFGILIAITDYGLDKLFKNILL